MDPPRRSTTSLKHLVLSPLPPSPPPPRTHSHTYLASPSYPSTPALLSRSSSRVRRAGPQPIATSPSSPALAKRPNYQKRRSGDAMGGVGVGDEESSWLLRTASALQMRGLEERGEGWMVKRESSTSLAGSATEGGGGDGYAVDVGKDDRGGEARYPMDGRRASRYASRQPSRFPSRVQSRAGSGVDLRRDGLRALTRINGVDEGEVKGMEGPDFVDPAVFEEGGSGGEEEVDEGEMRRVVMGRARGWVDWAVGWMDFRGEEEWEGEEGGQGDVQDGRDGEGRKRRGRGEEARGVKGGEEGGQRAVAGPAPQGQGDGVMADAKWLLGVASRIVM